MCSINHHLKAIYVHIPKNGGLYIQNILEKYYNFETIYFTRKDHYLFDIEENKEFNISNYKNINNGFINIKKQGVFRYYSTSDEFNKMSNMDDEKWNSYYKFTFVRNPYTKFVSAYKYVVDDNDISLNHFLEKKDNINNYIYSHAYITQYEHLLNKDNKIDFNYIGRFENLNSDLVSILFELKIEKIKHHKLIKNNIKINSNDNTSPYVDHYNTLNLPIINELFEIDFKTFNYEMHNDILEFNEKYLEKKDCFESDNILLYSKLLEEGKIELDDYEEQSIILDDESKIELNDISTCNSDTIFVNKLIDETMNLQKKKSNQISPEIVIQLFKTLKCTGLPNNSKVKIKKNN
jgi:hypothetical protein